MEIEDKIMSENKCSTCIHTPVCRFWHQVLMGEHKEEDFQELSKNCQYYKKQ